MGTTHVMECILCQVPETPWLGIEDQVVKVIKDIHPKEATHMLVVPRDHLTDWATRPQVLAHALHRILSKIQGPYYLRLNEGHPYRELPHCHIHVLSGHPLKERVPPRHILEITPNTTESVFVV